MCGYLNENKSRSAPTTAHMVVTIDALITLVLRKMCTYLLIMASTCRCKVWTAVWIENFWRWKRWKWKNNNRIDTAKRWEISLEITYIWKVVKTIVLDLHTSTHMIKYKWSLTKVTRFFFLFSPINCHECNFFLLDHIHDIDVVLL